MPSQRPVLQPIGGPGSSGRRGSGARARRRGLTLVEVLITVALIALMTGFAVVGSGMAEGARLKRGAVLIAGAIRVAYSHANAKGRPVRLVFDFGERVVALEEASGELFVDRTDRAGGASPATEAEKAAVAEADAILKGPRAPRPMFTPTKAFGFNPDAGKPGKELPQGIRFLQVETGHQEEGAVEDRAYLYFWPGGQTERAAIQVIVAKSDRDDDVMTILVSPLTGKTRIVKGPVAMPRPRDDAEESERSDSGGW